MPVYKHSDWSIVALIFFIGLGPVVYVLNTILTQKILIVDSEIIEQLQDCSSS